MIINSSLYPATANGTYSSETNPVDSLATHMNKIAETTKTTSDSISLSQEAYAALKEHAPDALQALGFNEKNPILEEVKEIAQEKYFHFGSDYLRLDKTQDEMISALDVANRFMDALNSIEPDDIYEALADSNRDSASSAMNHDISDLLQYV
ncbi:MAG: hypothetical protein C0602_10275 [Denitrovibrio sp.]|nr:MAG: hypothetical protein C0602_10275 [Denitrovibrio sp.]